MGINSLKWFMLVFLAESVIFSQRRQCKIMNKVLIDWQLSRVREAVFLYSLATLHDLKPALNWGVVMTAESALVSANQGRSSWTLKPLLCLRISKNQVLNIWSFVLWSLSLASPSHSLSCTFGLHTGMGLARRTLYPHLLLSKSWHVQGGCE